MEQEVRIDTSLGDKRRFTVESCCITSKTGVSLAAPVLLKTCSSIVRRPATRAEDMGHFGKLGRLVLTAAEGDHPATGVEWVIANRCGGT